MFGHSVRSFVPSLIQLSVFNIFWPNLKHRKKKVPRRFQAILHWVTALGKFLFNYYFKLEQLDIAGRLWLKYISFITLPKIRITTKKHSNKSCSASNFVQKSTPGHMSISHQSGARGLKRFVKRKVRRRF